MVTDTTHAPTTLAAEPRPLRRLYLALRDLDLKDRCRTWLPPYLAFWDTTIPQHPSVLDALVAAVGTLLIGTGLVGALVFLYIYLIPSVDSPGIAWTAWLAFPSSFATSLTAALLWLTEKTILRLVYLPVWSATWVVLLVFHSIPLLGLVPISSLLYSLYSSSPLSNTILSAEDPLILRALARGVESILPFLVLDLFPAIPFYTPQSLPIKLYVALTSFFDFSLLHFLLGLAASLDDSAPAPALAVVASPSSDLPSASRASS
ncbi:hypothetical protein JCM8097_003957 [Rhodosporidiobolus ruineniae]